MTRDDLRHITEAFKKCSDNDQQLMKHIETLAERVVALETRLNKLKWLETA